MRTAFLFPAGDGLVKIAISDEAVEIFPDPVADLAARFTPEEFGAQLKALAEARLGPKKSR
jgi:hypothetical protein